MKMKEKHRKNRIKDRLEVYERKLPTHRSGARKAAADHSPERRGRKRERSSSYYTSSCESASPRRRSRPSRPPSSPSPSPTRGRREKVRSAKGKSNRLSYSRSVSPRRYRRPASPPRHHRRSPSISSRRRDSERCSGRDSGRSSRRDAIYIPGLPRQETAYSRILPGDCQEQQEALTKALKDATTSAMQPGKPGMGSGFQPKEMQGSQIDSISIFILN